MPGQAAEGGAKPGWRRAGGEPRKNNGETQFLAREWVSCFKRFYFYLFKYLFYPLWVMRVSD
jgi:hypothetical protein